MQTSYTAVTAITYGSCLGSDAVSRLLCGAALRCALHCPFAIERSHILCASFLRAQEHIVAGKKLQGCDGASEKPPRLAPAFPNFGTLPNRLPLTGSSAGELVANKRVGTALSTLYWLHSTDQATLSLLQLNTSGASSLLLMESFFLLDALSHG